MYGVFLPLKNLRIQQVHILTTPSFNIYNLVFQAASSLQTFRLKFGMHS